MLLARLAQLLTRPRRRGGDHNLLGDRGEGVAAAMLRQKGYQIVARNWTCPLGEIDLICRDRDVVVYVEVKSGTSDQHDPEDHVNAAKRRQIRRAAAAHRQGMQPEPLVRFDIVAVVFRDDAEPIVRHHLDAFA